MRQLGVLLPTLLLSACLPLAHTQSTAFPRVMSGDWYYGFAPNETDYTFYDCRFSELGTFKCSVQDKGCGSFCEIQTFTASGAWRLDGHELTLRTTNGWGPEEQHLLLNGELSGILYFTNGTRWFRKRATRDKNVIGAPSNDSFKPKPLRGSA